MKMKLNIKILFLLLFLSLSLTAFSQNLSPVVEVRKAYKAKLMQIKKPDLKMAIPDSVLHFDLEFDYDSYTSTYKAPYEFRPYLLTMQPEAEVDKGASLYLKAGLGYTFHPYLDFIWTPKLESAFKMNVYVAHHSYFGNYVDSLNLNIKSWAKDTPKFKGYNARSLAGVDAGFDWEKLSLLMDIAYDGLAQKDNYKKREYDALDVSFRIFSRSIKPTRFHYDLGLDYRFAKDKLAYFDDTRNKLGEHNFSFYLSTGPIVRTNHKILFDAGVSMAAYNGVINSMVGNIYITPKYVYEKGRVLLSAGVRTSIPLQRDTTYLNHQTRQRLIFPDFTFNLTAIENALDLYVMAKGGNDINTYSSILKRNNFYDIKNYGYIDNTIERISAVIGLKGRISSVFSYNLRGGYAYMINSLEDALFVSEDRSIIAPQLGYIDYNKGFAALDLYLNTKSVDVSSSLLYTYTDIAMRDQPIFAPAALKGNASVIYNWKKRIYTGIDCDFATNRQTEVKRQVGAETIIDTYKIYGYADLGLYLEYRTSTKLSFWVRGGNLLFMNVQKSPFYAEKGGNFTAGICLNL